MPLTRAQDAILREIDHKLILLTERQNKQFETQDKIKARMDGVETTLYKNGLNSRVKEIHDWMMEQRRLASATALQDDQQEQEIKLLGVKMSAELKQNIITGVITGSFALVGILLSK